MPIRVTQILEATTGGTGRHLLDLIDGLDSDRIALESVVSLRRDPLFRAQIEQRRARGAIIHEVPMQRAIRPWSDMRALVTLTRLLRRSRPEIVHTHSSKAGFLGRLAARRAGIPAVVHTPHGFAFDAGVSKRLRRRYLRLEKRAMAWTDQLVCVCQAEQRAAARVGLAGEEQTTVVPNGIRPTTPPAPEALSAWRKVNGLTAGDLLVVACGRLCPQKGFHDLISAFFPVAAMIPEAHLIIAGTGGDHAALQAHADDLELGRQFQLISPPEEVHLLYGAADVVAFSSRWEALPYALLDALAAGRPVVAPDVGGMPRLVSQSSGGLIVPAGDTSAHSRALIGLLSDDALRATFGHNAAQFMQRHHRLDAMLWGLESLYEDLAPVEKEETTP